MADQALDTALSAAVDRNWSKEIDWLRTLVSFPSIRGGEAECQAWIADQFASRGWQTDVYRLSDVDLAKHPASAPAVGVDYDQSIQVVATLPPPRQPSAAGHSLILQGHVDVVPEGPVHNWKHPPFEPIIEGDWMQGRGAMDMKAGLACAVFALDALKTAGYAPGANIIVQSVTEEESTGNGAVSTLLRGYKADACLIPEPSGNRITRAHTGALWARIRIEVPPTHVQFTRAGDNAISAAYGLLKGLNQLTGRLNEEARTHPWFGEVQDPIKFNPGRIKGGDWTSSSPSWCEIDCRIGVLPGKSIQTAKKEVQDAIADAARDTRLLADHPPQVSWHGMQAEGYVLEPGSQAETALAAAHHSIFGETMPERLASGANDTRFYALHHGIVGLCYGPSGEGMHGYDERINLSSMKKTTQVIAKFVALWCGLDHKS